MAIKIIYPIKGKVDITFKFGEAPQWYLTIFKVPHDGIDFSCPVGTPVVACDDGVIIFVDKIADSNGCGVQLKHSWGTSLYWHLSESSATLGQKFNKGDVIGLSGNTGITTGAHLHFSCQKYKNGHDGALIKFDPLENIEDSGVIVANPIITAKYYTVKWLDSLWKIAGKVYGNNYRWTEIYYANKNLILNPNKLKIGWKLLIP